MSNETSHRDIPTPPHEPLAMTPAEVLRNIAIKTSMRTPVDNQGRPTEPSRNVTYDYDELGRITSVATSSGDDQELHLAHEVAASASMQALRSKAAANLQAIQEFHDLAKNDPAALGNYQH